MPHALDDLEAEVHEEARLAEIEANLGSAPPSIHFDDAPLEALQGSVEDDYPVVLVEDHLRFIGAFAQGDKMKEKLFVAIHEGRAVLIVAEEAVKTIGSPQDPELIDGQFLGLEENVAREDGEHLVFLDFPVFPDIHDALGHEKALIAEKRRGPDALDEFVLFGRSYLDRIIKHSSGAFEDTMAWPKGQSVVKGGGSAADSQRV